MITLRVACHTPIGKMMIDKGLGKKLLEPKISFLAIYLMQEGKKKDSPYKEYLNMLPKSFSQFPIFFTEDEKVFLKGSPFLDQVN